MELLERQLDETGVITHDYCKKMGIATTYLYRLAKMKSLTKLERGVYVSDWFMDEHFSFQYRFKKAIYSRETALFLLNETDKIPPRLSVNVPNGYKFNNSIEASISYSKPDVYEEGIIEIETPFGNKVKSHSYERVLCDFIKHKKDIEREVYIEAIRNYKNFKNKNVKNLFEISERMGILSKVIDIFEIL